MEQREPGSDRKSDAEPSTRPDDDKQDDATSSPPTVTCLPVNVDTVVAKVKYRQRRQPGDNNTPQPEVRRKTRASAKTSFREAESNICSTLGGSLRCHGDRSAMHSPNSQGEHASTCPSEC